MEPCPHCHRAMPKPKPIKATLGEPSTLSDAALYAHFKKTAPIEDLKFFLNCPSLPGNVRRDASVLLAETMAKPLPRATFYRRLTALQDRWRRVSLAREDAEALFARAVEQAA